MPSTLSFCKFDDEPAKPGHFAAVVVGWTAGRVGEWDMFVEANAQVTVLDSSYSHSM